MEPTLITRAGSVYGGSPATDASSIGRRNRVRWKTPCRLRLSTRSHAAASCSASCAPQTAPALFTSTSSASQRSPTAPANRRHPSSLARSSATAQHSPTPDNSSATEAHASALRLLIKTDAPFSTNARAIINPIPEVPPVTTTRLPRTENNSLISVPTSTHPVYADSLELHH